MFSNTIQIYDIFKILHIYRNGSKTVRNYELQELAGSSTVGYFTYFLIILIGIVELF